MKYDRIMTAEFVRRINRFTAEIKIDGTPEICHVKNTGRLGELLVPGARAFVQQSDKEDRKTKYSLVGVVKDGRVVNTDSQAPNKVFYEWVKKGGFVDGVTLIKPEKTFGDSRFDCYIEAQERKIFVEVKGVTLEKDGIALFPDAPTERGVKHLRGLCECVRQGFEAYIVFVVQMKGVRGFAPNKETHREFAKSLLECSTCGVNILCLDCDVTENTLEISEEIPVDLQR